MSHKATAWLADVENVSPSEFRILFILCDCHSPSRGCFPSQAYMNSKSGMSSASINNQLNTLTDKGLIRRERRVDPVTKQRRSTLYFLGFEMGDPTPEIGDRANSKKRPKPTPKNGQSQLQFLETNLVIEEPVIEPVTAREELLLVLSPEIVDAYIDHRKSKQAKLKQYAAKLIARKLADHPNPDACVELSIMNGWTGVFPEKTKVFQNGQQPTSSSIAAAGDRIAARLR